MPKGLALRDVVDRPIESGLGRGCCGDGHEKALLGQLGDEVFEPAALFTDEVSGRNAHVVEEEFRCVLGLHPDLVQDLAAAKTGTVAFDEEQADGVAAPGLIGFRGHHEEVGDLAVGDEYLLPAQDIIVAVAAGARGEAAQIRSGSRLGHGDRPDRLARRHSGKPPALQVLAAVVEEVRGHDVGMEIEQNARSPGAGDFLGDDGRMPEVAAAASIFVGKSGAKQPGLTGRSPERRARPGQLLPTRRGAGRFPRRRNGERHPGRSDALLGNSRSISSLPLLHGRRLAAGVKGRQPTEPSPQFLTRGQPPSSSGRNASFAGIVATSL